ncbi:riboflavin synthase domain-like protein [Wallemia mellicola]|uniref:NADPH-dependent diflavin oxidoreductase 1 n=1 Tax=Wallemia mellicola TaxID=1708541 RepID=A0A4T0QX52_9BASI|nr:riboflavin synthase domain-like protein [Wallemia mellicola]TIC29816.1 riboflavin synthase domain-like protein [Wallemia mellicola]
MFIALYTAILLSCLAIAEVITPPQEVIIGVPPSIPFNAPFEWGYTLNQSDSNLVRFDYTLARLIAPSGESPSQQPNGTLARLFPDDIDTKSTPYTIDLPPGTQSRSYRSSQSGRRSVDLTKRSSSIYSIDDKAVNDTSTRLCLDNNNFTAPYYWGWHNSTEPGKWTVQVRSLILYGVNGYESSDDGNQTCISPPYTFESLDAKAEFSVSTLEADEIEMSTTSLQNDEESKTSTFTPQISATATRVEAQFSPSPTGNILISDSDRTISRSVVIYRYLESSEKLAHWVLTVGISDFVANFSIHSPQFYLTSPSSSEFEERHIQHLCHLHSGFRHWAVFLVLSLYTPPECPLMTYLDDQIKNLGLDDADERELVIVYSTETGNAQDIAERLHREAERWRWMVHVYDVEDFDVNTLLNSPIVIFVVSTTGNGEHNKSFRPLWRLLLNSTLPADLLEDLTFAVFGLGDSGYARFNWAAKSLSRRLQSLGAQMLVPRGDGDERHYMGFDGVFLPWSKGLFEALQVVCPLRDGLERLPDDYLPAPRVGLRFLPGEEAQVKDDKPTAVEGSHQCTLRRSDRITSEEWWQDVRHIILDKPPSLTYDAGDVAVLTPSNNPDAVDELIRLLRWETHADTPLKLTGTVPHRLQEYINRPTTIRSLLTYSLSPFSVPRTTFFEFLAHFTSNNLEKDRLREFLSVEGADDLFEYCTRVRRTAAEVLADFKSVRVPVEYILDVFSVMRPRKFSIAGLHPTKIELCVALVKYKTKLVKPRQGVCSTWIESLAEGATIDISVEEGTIHAPKDPNKPLLLVGPGTGVAPMRALVQKRKAMGASHTALYFGCRMSAMDELYAEEFNKSDELVYKIAHSRDDKEGNKEYVQHILQKDGKRVYNWLIERAGYLFISGSSGQMPKAVKKAIGSIIERLENIPNETAMHTVEQLEKQGRIVEECW